MVKSIIFYGAGKYTEMNLTRWINEGIVPACFADSNVQKHGKKLLEYTICSINMQYVL